MPARRVSGSLFGHPVPSGVYTLSLHDALPIFTGSTTSALASADDRRDAVNAPRADAASRTPPSDARLVPWAQRGVTLRSEEHTSELQSHSDLVCRRLLEKTNSVLAMTWIALTH